MKPILFATAAALIVTTAAAPTAAGAAPLVGVAFASAAAPAKFVDTCTPLRQPFIRAKNYVRDETLKGIGIGIVGGVLSGLLLGGRNKGQAALAGGLTGAAVGGTAAYIAAKRQQAHTQGELQALISNDFDPRMQVYSGLARDLAVLGDCRRGQIYQLRRGVETSAIPRDQARLQLASIQQAIVQDDSLVSAAAASQTHQVGEYSQAYAMASGMSESEARSAPESAAGLSEQDISSFVVPVSVVRADASGALPPPEPEPAAAPSTPAETRYIGGRQSVHLFGEPSVGAAILTNVPPGEAVEMRVVADHPGWAQVRWNGRSGFVTAGALTEEPAGASGAVASRRTKAVVAKAIPAPVVVARPVAAPPRREPQGPRLLRVANVRVLADTPQKKLASAMAGSRTMAIVQRQNAAATAIEMADAERLVGTI